MRVVSWPISITVPDVSIALTSYNFLRWSIIQILRHVEYQSPWPMTIDHRTRHDLIIAGIKCILKEMMHYWLITSAWLICIVPDKRYRRYRAVERRSDVNVFYLRMIDYGEIAFSIFNISSRSVSCNIIVLFDPESTPTCIYIYTTKAYMYMSIRKSTWHCRVSFQFQIVNYFIVIMSRPDIPCIKPIIGLNQ